MARTVVALFDTYDEAERALPDLVDAGIPRDAVSVVANSAKGTNPTLDASAENADASSVGTGAASGAAIGGVAGLVLGLGALAIPGVGPVLAAGPLVAALTGAGVGAATGGLLGALAGLGVPADDAHFYAEGVRRGGALVTVKTDETHADRASEILNRHGAVDVDDRVLRDRQSERNMTKEPATPTEPSSALDPRTSSAQSLAGAAVPPASRRVRVYSDPAASAMSGSLGMGGMTAPTSTYDDLDSDFRNHHQETHGTSIHGFDRYGPAYRYGYNAAGDPRYTGRPYGSIEADLRRDYERDYPGSMWDDVKEAVRHAYERVAGRR